MAEDQSRQNDEQKKVQRTEQPAAGSEGLLASDNTPSYPISLLGDPNLGGRGNSPVRNALMLQMQRTYGNQATRRYIQKSAGGLSVARQKGINHDVQRFLQRAPATGGTTPESPGPEDEKDKKNAPALSGSLPPVEGEPVIKTGCDHAGKDDNVPSSSSPVSASSTATAKQLPVVAELTFDSSEETGQVIGESPKEDRVKTTLAFGSSVTGGGPVGAGNFGEEHVKYKVDNVDWKTTKGAVMVKARVFLDCTWGTQAQGRTNISSGNDPNVKSTTWKDVAKDLKPDATGRPTRNLYWAQDITERHEKFHAKDDIRRAKLYLPAAKAWLNTQTLSVGTGLIDSILTSVQLSLLVETMRQNIEADGWAYYGTGGENRAYADGKASYQARVAAVKARAASQKWK